MTFGTGRGADESNCGDPQMTERETLASRVEELTYFPFPSFEKVMEAVVSGDACYAVDRGFALKWAQGGVYAPRSVVILTTLSAWLPILAALSFVIWIFISKNWAMFLALPVLLIGYAVYHPGLGSLLGPIRTLLIGLTFVGLFYGLLFERPKILTLCAALSLVWFGIKASYSISVKGLIRAALANEKLLCALWQDEKISIEMKNGDRYWKNFRVINGEPSSYT